MADFELQTSPPITSNQVYVLVRNTAAQVWDDVNSVFTTYVDGDIANYALNQTQQGTSGFWTGSMPAAILTPDTYQINAYKQLGGSPANGDTLIGTGELVWRGATTTSTVSGDWTTRDYVKAILQITTTNYDQAINLLISSVSAEFSRALGRDIALTDYVENRNGLGTDWIRVWNPPVASLTSIVFDNNTIIPMTVDDTEFVIDNSTGIIKFRQGAAHWRGFDEGFQNIQVNYQGGFAVIPLDLQMAVARGIAKMLFQYNLNDSMNVQAKKEGDKQLTFFQGISAINPDEPLWADVWATLKRYGICQIRY